ncbi:hypothetical protein CYY_001247 [Polysphondylium violaceum]|uniref:TCP-1-eta n=1 Tax=Polysphondylium violaceum TaxID=133409 RepID=A0A8J4VAT0_9MYCE|nr:hypothetical protein CYY_001247 [Polysphondylium violaceum]
MSTTTIETIKANVEACQSLFYCLKTTLGPYGRDKLIVDSDGNYLSSNDGATILQYLDIKHPATRLLIGIAKSQDETIGDGTTSVVLLACLLLTNALKYILLNTHPNHIIKGYQLALDYSLKIIDDLKIPLFIGYDQNNSNSNSKDVYKKMFRNDVFINQLYNVASTSISSKILNRYSNHFSNIGVGAIKKLQDNPMQDLIRVIGIQGQSMLDSFLIDGVLLPFDNNTHSNSSSGNTIFKDPIIIIGKLHLDQIQSEIQNTKIIYSSSSSTTSTSSTQQEFRENEKRIYLSKLELIFKLNVNIIISDTSIPLILINLFKEKGILYFCIQDSRELEIISHCLGIKMIYDISNFNINHLNNNNSKNNDNHSEAKSISIGDKFYLQINKNNNDNNDKLSCAATVVLRAPTDSMIQECIRSFKDMLNVLSSTVRNPFIIGGGGCGYLEISKKLKEKANGVKDLKLQLSLNAYADSLESIPMILIQNAGFDSLDLIKQLLNIHNQPNNQWMGVNLDTGSIVDMLSDLNVKEPSFLLSNILTLSSRAAQMILRINNNILIEPRPEFHQQQ